MPPGMHFTPIFNPLIPPFKVVRSKTRELNQVLSWAISLSFLTMAHHSQEKRGREVPSWVIPPFLPLMESHSQKKGGREVPPWTIPPSPGCGEPQLEERGTKFAGLVWFV